MRIENFTGITAASHSGVSDLLSRLETGDTIRAKVLETSPEGIVLKFSDGSVLKAKTIKFPDVKPGQVVMLSVVSKSEGTLFLETVKDQAGTLSANPTSLKDLLVSIDIKPDVISLELASEFLKSGVELTSKHIETALSHMNFNSGINAEKAVFLTIHDIPAGVVNPETLAGLLDGKIKLGDQLRNLMALLDTSATGDKLQGNQDIHGYIGINPENLPSAPAETTAGASSLSGVKIEEPFRNTADGARLVINSGNNDIDGTRDGMTGGTPENNAVLRNEPLNGNTRDIWFLRDPGTSAKDGTAPDNTVAGNVLPSGRISLFPHGQNVPGSAGISDTKPVYFMDVPQNNGNVIIPGEVNQLLLKDDNGLATTAPETGKIKELFANTKSGNLASEIAAEKVMKAVTEKLEELKASIKFTGYLPSDEGKNLATVLSLLDETTKTLNFLHSKNVFYFQLPVNIAGYYTTAELYVMRRKRSKKTGDEQSVVAFISLDTENLGRIETVVDLKGRSVILNIRTEKQQVNECIKKNVKLLYSGLSESGYKLADIRYSIINNPATPTEQEKILISKVNERYGKIDYRI